MRGNITALLVTDVAARGLDIPGCDAVIQLEVPATAKQYAHRAGRTGRMGAPGVVVSIVERHEVGHLLQMAKRLHIIMKVGLCWICTPEVPFLHLLNILLMGCLHVHCARLNCCVGFELEVC